MGKEKPGTRGRGPDQDRFTILDAAVRGCLAKNGCLSWDLKEGSKPGRWT